MNAVWKDLDPIFKSTLRKYATQGNRLLFDVYAKAVGFNPSHVGLLYLTLKLEEDHLETTDRSLYPQNKRTHNEEEHQTNDYLQISVYNDPLNTTHNAHDTRHGIIENKSTSDDTIHPHHTLALPSLNMMDSFDTERPSKRRKISLDDDQRVSYEHNIKKELDLNVDNTPLEQPLLHSVVCRVIHEENESNTNSVETESRSVAETRKIPSVLPTYDLHNKSSYSDTHQHLYSNEHKSDKTEHEELNEYEKLKAFSNRFKHQKLPNSVVQSNKKKIGALLANCHAYRDSLIKRHSMMTRTRTIRHTMATTTVSNYTRNRKWLSSK